MKLLPVPALASLLRSALPDPWTPAAALSRFGTGTSDRSRADLRALCADQCRQCTFQGSLLKKIAKCYPTNNSVLQADTDSNLLHHPLMVSLKAQKEVRRQNVARLLDERGQTALADITGYSPSQLYQFGRGRGRSARSVNDEVARTIEKKLRLPAGWMDASHDGNGGHESRTPIHIQAPDDAIHWPFPISRSRFDALSHAGKAAVVDSFVAAVEFQERKELSEAPTKIRKKKALSA